MNPLTAMLTDILTSNDWSRLAILADFVEETMTTANCKQRQADAAWLRTAGIAKEAVNGVQWFQVWSEDSESYDDFDTREEGIAELFKRVLATFGLEKVGCKPCRGTGEDQYLHRVDGKWECRKCGPCFGRGWNLAEVGPCQRCGGNGKQTWYTWDPATDTTSNHREKTCPICQCQGTVAKEPA